MSIEYDKQKINLAVIIIANFHNFNFECFWLDDGGTSTKALDLRTTMRSKKSEFQLKTASSPIAST